MSKKTKKNSRKSLAAAGDTDFALMGYQVFFEIRVRYGPLRFWGVGWHLCVTDDALIITFGNGRARVIIICVFKLRATCIETVGVVISAFTPPVLDRIWVSSAARTPRANR